MDRTAMIAAAKEFQSHVIELHNPALVKLERERLVDFALSLFQWKRISTEDDLPKECGWYTARYEHHVVPSLVWFFTDDAGSANRWLTQIVAYIPIPIPQFKEGEDETKM